MIDIPDPSRASHAFPLSASGAGPFPDQRAVTILPRLKAISAQRLHSLGGVEQR
jgi:hypothetical protein